MDIFSQFGDIFGSAFGGFGGFGGSTTRRSKGTNLRIKISLTINEIAQGVSKKIKVKRKVQAPGLEYSTCRTCNGTGQVTKYTNTILGRMQSTSVCDNCSGTGKIVINKPSGSDSNGQILEEEMVDVKIPAGVEDGMQLRVSGKGNEPITDGIPGDLLILVNELEDENLKRRKQPLWLVHKFFWRCSWYFKEIDTVTGKVRIKLDAGIQSGKILRLRGKGLKSINSHGSGDLLVHVNVWTPKTLSKDQKSFFEQMQDDDHFKSPDKTDKSFEKWTCFHNL